MLKIFEIKNGVYNIQEGENEKWQIYFLVFDNKYPEDESLLLTPDEFEKSKVGKKYQIGYCTSKGFANTPRERCQLVELVHFTSHYVSHCYYSN